MKSSTLQNFQNPKSQNLNSQISESCTQIAPTCHCERDSAKQSISDSQISESKTQKIPKVIHYCWFGGKPLPKLAQKCIASWQRFCPDYEIKRWDESNYDVSKCQYMLDAHTQRKWGFVSDCARFDIVYENGGIYFDTDVEVIKPLDELLTQRAILAFESPTLVASGLIVAAVPKLALFKEMFDFYHTISFYKKNGELNLLPCPHYNTQILLKHGLELSKHAQIQRVADITIYPIDYFCPISVDDGRLNITPNTYTIHHFAGSWIPAWRRVGRKTALAIGGVKLKNFIKSTLFNGGGGGNPLQAKKSAFYLSHCASSQRSVV